MGEDELRARVEALEAENKRLRGELQADGFAVNLRGSSKREALLVEAERVAQLGSWVWDLRSGAIEWSDQFYRILGLEPGSVAPSSERFFAAIDEADRERVREAAELATRTGAPDPCDFRIASATGEVRNVRLTGVMLTDEHGGFTHMVGTVLDTTESSRAAKLLSRTVDELRSAQRVARLASFTWDPALNRIEWSSGMYTLLGLSGDETPSEELFREHVHPADLPFLSAKRAECLNTGVPEPIEFRIVRRDGTELDVALESQPLHDATGSLQGFRGVIQDITRRKALEEQLRQSQKMEAIGTLAGGVAHDFNNYLMVLEGQAELLHAALGAGHPALPSVDAIATACERCAGLTSQLLTLSRKRPADVRSVDLGALIVRMVPVLRTVIGDASELVIVNDEPSAMIKADPAHVEQVLMNLAVNARDAMPDGGYLTLTVERAVHVTRSTEGPDSQQPYVRLSVADTGAGIAPEHRGRIFEPFFTTKGVGRGTGLGLSTAYGIVQQVGGQIEVESELGHGTTFHIYWPPGVKTQADTPSSAPEPPPADRVERTVLLVEDVAEVREVLRAQLERAGHRVLTAHHGAAALEIAQREQGHVDVVVSDVVMPVMGGLELERRLEALYPEVRCLLMTGYAEDVLRDRPASRRVLRKPFAIKELLSALRRLCDVQLPRAAAAPKAAATAEPPR